jgi:hypothetical protein
MSRRSEWEHIAAGKLDKNIYGRVIRAYRNRRHSIIRLVHYKFHSRRHPKYESEGMWVVIDGTTVVRRKQYRFKAINLPPTTWANRVLRCHLDGTYARERAQQVEKTEADSREMEEARAAKRVRPPGPEDEAAEARFGRFLCECYERNIGPLDDPEPDDVQQEPQPRVSVCTPTHSSDVLDHRPKRFRTVVNYHVPAAFDELPTKLVCFRQRESNHFNRSLRRKPSRLPTVLPILPWSIPHLPNSVVGSSLTAWADLVSASQMSRGTLPRLRPLAW